MHSPVHVCHAHVHATGPSPLSFSLSSSPAVQLSVIYAKASRAVLSRKRVIHAIRTHVCTRYVQCHVPYAPQLNTYMHALARERDRGRGRGRGRKIACTRWRNTRRTHTTYGARESVTDGVRRISPSYDRIRAHARIHTRAYNVWALISFDRVLYRGSEGGLLSRAAQRGSGVNWATR